MAAFGVIAGYSVYFFTDEIGMEREKIVKDKDSKFERFKKEKNVELASASKKILEAKAIAAKAQERTESLENANLKLRGTVATLQERAAKAENDLLKMQEHFAWRDLNSEQQARMLAKLKEPSGTEFDVRVFQDPEALRFLNVMVEILHFAGWIQRPTEGVIEISTKYGVAGITLSGGVTVRNPINHPELMDAAKAFSASLMAEGIAAKRTEYEVERNPPRLHIAIEQKIRLA